MKAPGQVLRGWLLVKPECPDARLSNAGHLMLALAVVSLACGGLILVRCEAQKRLNSLAYCHLEPVRLQQLMTPAASNLAALARALPSATSLQRQRLVQQANEFVLLDRYHCKSMQLISANYQSLVMVANGSAMVALIMLALLSVNGLKSEIRWPFTVLMASAFTLGLAVVSIETFNVNDNLKTSRRLYEQSVSLTRTFATSIANQNYEGPDQNLDLLNRQELGQFIAITDQQLSRIDIPTFVMNDNFASKEALLLLRKASPSESDGEKDVKN